jgi:hypothetical protein
MIFTLVPALIFFWNFSQKPLTWRDKFHDMRGWIPQHGRINFPYYAGMQPCLVREESWKKLKIFYSVVLKYIINCRISGRYLSKILEKLLKLKQCHLWIAPKFQIFTSILIFAFWPLSYFGLDLGWAAMGFDFLFYQYLFLYLTFDFCLLFSKTSY